MRHRNDIILEVILNKIKAQYKDDVSLVCCYGSYINGTATEKSDLDFYYVPKTDRAFELTKTFILDGIGFDFWPVRWDRLERIANFDDLLIPLIAECRIVYCNSPEDEIRFLDLKNRIQDTINKDVDGEMLKKAEKRIKSAMAEYFGLLLSSDMCDIRTSSGLLLMEVSNAVALMNNSYFSYGIKKHLQELLAFKNLPSSFEQYYCSIIGSSTPEEVKDNCLKIIDSTYSLWKQLHDSLKAANDPKEALSGFYEELCSTWNKVYNACDKRNANLAFLAGTCIQRELDAVSNYCTFPHIKSMGNFMADDLELFKNAQEQSEKIMVKKLEEYNIDIKRYSSIDEFRLDF